MGADHVKGLFKYDVGEMLGDGNAVGSIRSRLYDVDKDKRVYVVDWDLPFGNDWSITNEEELDELDIIEEEEK